MDNKEYYQKFLDSWGLDSQILMTLEEMNELGMALTKYLRYGADNLLVAQMANIIEEIGDVKNMIEQLQLAFGWDKVEAGRMAKLQRTLNRLDQNK